MNASDSSARSQPESTPGKAPIRVADDGVVYNEFRGSDDFTKTIRCTYFIAVLFSEGSGFHSIDGVEHAVGPKQLHFLFPGQHHHWQVCPSTQARRVVVGRKVFESFSSTEVFHLIRYNPNPVFKLDDHTFDSINQELGAISRLLNSEEFDDSWQALLSIRMDLLALLISRQAEDYITQTVLKNSGKFVKDFWTLINKHAGNRQTVSWYAGQLGIDTSYLSVLTRRDLNLTPKELIDQRTVLEAKQRLRFSDRSVKQIAYDLGFPNMSSFSNHFRKHTGFWPKEYKQ